MELAVYFANLQGLLAIEDALLLIDPTQIHAFVETIMFGDDISNKEYYGNLVALTWMEPILGEENEYGRVYFGQEFCEHLIPSPDELEQAYYFTRQLGWDFTYVTGYVTDAGLNKIRKNLDRLETLQAACEVVINDWGVLRVLRRETNGFTPVLGRLLTKQLRLGRFNRRTTPPPVNMNGLKATEESIREHQVQAYRDIDLANPAWREQLNQLGIRRADLDMTPQGIEIPDEGWGNLTLSYYYPWGYLAGGRNCMTAGVVEPERQFVAMDRPCTRPCQRLNKTACIDHYPEMTIQRGNSLFVFHGDYASRYFVEGAGHSRLVFEPYIPI